MSCMYSLESYAKYRTVTVRPRLAAETPADRERGSCDFIELDWSILEPERGVFLLDELKGALHSASNPVLVLRPDLPSWVPAEPASYYASFVRKIGSMADRVGGLAGVVISSLAGGKEEWNAYADAFEAVPILADLHNPGLIRHLRSRNRAFGLLIRCGDENRIECCEAMAREGLHHLWKSQPVVLQLADSDCGLALERDAHRWHASLANAKLGLGCRLELRRMTYPETVSSGGSLPVRLWLVNSGSVKMYRPSVLKLRLRRGDDVWELPIAADTRAWLTGDIVHNEALTLPALPAGAYRVSLGLFDGESSPVPLHIEGLGEDGYFEAGTMEIEESVDRLLNIWDFYYPEGYYPLEDPQVPDSTKTGPAASSSTDTRG